MAQYYANSSAPTAGATSSNSATRRSLTSTRWAELHAKSQREGPRGTMTFVRRTLAKTAHSSSDTYTRTGTYRGEWAADAPEGYGVREDARGCRFEGEWRKGLRHGRGTDLRRAADGSWIKLYEGDWVDGLRCGIGRAWEPVEHDPAPAGGGGAALREVAVSGNGAALGAVSSAAGAQDGDCVDLYEGEWRGGLRWGQGTQRYVRSGNVYTGAWEEGLQHGTGTLTLANGDAYTGGWSRGRKHGNG
jgi:hypothetical protein